jgi:hypothetical protein
MKKYALTVNEKQAEILIRALDVYSRIHMFQLEDVANILKWDNRRVYDLDEKEIPMENLTRLSEAILDLKSEFLNCPRNASHGIYSKSINDAARVAYDIQQVVRYGLWSNSPDKGQRRHTVWSNEPMRSSQELLPKIDPVEEPC